jgi:hypothetical protein
MEYLIKEFKKFNPNGKSLKDNSRDVVIEKLNKSYKNLSDEFDEIMEEKRC